MYNTTPNNKTFYYYPISSTLCHVLLPHNRVYTQSKARPQHPCSGLMYIHI